MYCKKCGKPINEGEKFCTACGSQAKANSPVQPQQTDITKQMNKTQAQPLQEENKTYGSIKKSTILKITSIVLAVVFFFPFFTVSCSGQSVSFSGFDLAFGKNIEGMQSQSAPVLLILLLLPVAAVIISYLKKSELIDKAVYAISSIICFVTLMITNNQLSQYASEHYCTATAQIGFYLSCIGHLIVIVFALFIKNKNTVNQQNAINQNTTRND